MILQQLFENNRKWVEETLDGNENYFENLSKGQSPEILYIGCSDSRVTAEELMGLKPGEAFVLRNIANMVANLDLGSISAINYAVDHLKVNHIIVCGHYNCGGVKAAMETKNLGIINPWVKNIRDVYRLHQDELSTLADEEARYKRLVELNVQEQCINLLKTSEVQMAIRDRELKLYGWVFDIHTGKLLDLNIDLNKVFDGIKGIYSLI